MARSFLFLHLIALLSSTTRIEVAAEWTPSLTGNPGQVDAQTAEKLERMLQPQLRGSNPSSTSSSASILVGGGKSRGDGKDDTAQRKLQYYPQYYPPYYPQYYGYGRLSCVPPLLHLRSPLGDSIHPISSNQASYLFFCPALA